MAEQEESPQEQPKSGAKKLVIVLGAVVLIEAVAIFGVLLLGGGPDPVEASQAAADEQLELEKPAELLVVAEKFQNIKSGRPFIYDTEISIVVQQKNVDLLATRIENRLARISSDIGIIFRSAEPAFLIEPELSTLKRQVTAKLNERLGMDPDTGEAYIQEVLIKTKQFRADG